MSLPHSYANKRQKTQMEEKVGIYIFCLLSVSLCYYVKISINAKSCIEI